MGGFMLVVAGTIDVRAEDRSAYLEARQAAISMTRAEEGCLEYAFSADSSDAGRVRVFEIWESDAALDNHLRRLDGSASNGVRSLVVARDLRRYVVSSSSPLRST